MTKVKVRKVNLRNRDLELVDCAGRAYMQVDFEGACANDVLWAINLELKEHGVQLVLGDAGEYYGIRAEKLKGGK